MIKNNYEIRLRDFDMLERLGRIDQFKRWYNILPAKLFAKKIQKHIVDITNMINDDHSGDLDLKLLEYQTKRSLEINKLKGLEMLLILALDGSAKLQVAKNKIRSRRLRKVKDGNEWFSYACRKIQESTGIEINNIDDIVRFQKYVQTTIDRYNERMAVNIRNKNTSGEKTTLIALAISIALYLEVDPSRIEGMRILHFLEMRKQAINKMEQEKKQIDKMKAHGTGLK